MFAVFKNISIFASDNNLKNQKNDNFSNIN